MGNLFLRSTLSEIRNSRNDTTYSAPRVPVYLLRYKNQQAPVLRKRHIHWRQCHPFSALYSWEDLSQDKKAPTPIPSGHIPPKHPVILPRTEPAASNSA